LAIPKTRVGPDDKHGVTYLTGDEVDMPSRDTFVLLAAPERAR
jgi:hypothetical protein